MSSTNRTVTCYCSQCRLWFGSIRMERGGPAYTAGVQPYRLPQHGAADDCGEVGELFAGVAAAHPRGGPAHLRAHGVPRPHVHPQGAGRHGQPGKGLRAAPTNQHYF